MRALQLASHPAVAHPLVRSHTRAYTAHGSTRPRMLGEQSEATLMLA
ncbi:hypothetical protein BH18ACT12_BH18ACT12_00680 [soil metagenome]